MVKGMPTPTPPLPYGELGRLLSVMTGDEKHAPSATSTLDVLWVLYDRVLRVSASALEDPERDRFVLSKGHGPMAYYAVLAAKGFVPLAELRRFGAYDSLLGHHPDRVLVPGAEVGSGSLGHGLPIAVGMALGLRIQERFRPRVVVLLGDAELDEGSNHEAIAVAGRLGLDSLTAIVIDNQSASHGWPGGIAARFSTEGWTARTVSGREHTTLAQALTLPRDGRPQAVVATVEPKG
jgi:transketolase